MNCDRCGTPIADGNEMQHHGRNLCEDCYMDALSPARACDPWAVYTAKSFSDTQPALTETQKRILQVLKETGGVEPTALSEMLNMKMGDLEREFATLRHMEKVRAKMHNGRKIICLW